MPDINEQCWNVIGALGSDEGIELPPAAVERLMMMGLVARDAKRKLCLTADGQRAYVALESGGDFPGLE